MADLIIVKHTRVCLPLTASVSESTSVVLRSRLLYLHVWSEHLSSSSRRCKTAKQASAADALRKRDPTHFQTITAAVSNVSLMPSPGGERRTLCLCVQAQMQIDRCRFIIFIFSPSSRWLTIFSNYLPCHTHKLKLYGNKPCSALNNKIQIIHKTPSFFIYIFFFYAYGQSGSIHFF